MAAPADIQAAEPELSHESSTVYEKVWNPNSKSISIKARQVPVADMAQENGPKGEKSFGTDPADLSSSDEEPKQSITAHLGEMSKRAEPPAEPETEKKDEVQSPEPQASISVDNNAFEGKTEKTDQVKSPDTQATANVDDGKTEKKDNIKSSETVAKVAS